MTHLGTKKAAKSRMRVSATARCFQHLDECSHRFSWKSSIFIFVAAKIKYDKYHMREEQEVKWAKTADWEFKLLFPICFGLPALLFSGVHQNTQAITWSIVFESLVWLCVFSMPAFMLYTAGYQLGIQHGQDKNRPTRKWW